MFLMMPEFSCNTDVSAVYESDWRAAKL